MRQTELNRAVARATGETVERVSRMGFSLVPGPNAGPGVCRDSAGGGRPRTAAPRPRRFASRPT
jgi:hypothetical protein